MNVELDVARTAARKAGSIILHYYKSDYQVRDKGYHNPVTTADDASNDHLKDILLSAFPDYGWLSEETADSTERFRKERVWVVDPLDGTKEFIEGVPNFVVSVALVEDGRPVMGVLFNPVTEELFTAVVGCGAFLNGERIVCSQGVDPSKSVVLNSRSETKRGLWLPFKNKFKELRPVGSVAYKLALTAANKADLFVSVRPKHEWDVSAGHCIVNESGAILRGLKGNAITYNKKNLLITPGIIAGNSKLVENTLPFFSNLD